MIVFFSIYVIICLFHKGDNDTSLFDNSTQRAKYLGEVHGVLNGLSMMNGKRKIILNIKIVQKKKYGKSFFFFWSIDLLTLLLLLLFFLGKDFDAFAYMTQSLKERLKSAMQARIGESFVANFIKDLHIGAAILILNESYVMMNSIL